MDNEQPQPAPLGVMPEWRWREIRVEEILLAMARFSGAHKHHDVKMLEWANELQRHLIFLAERKSRNEP